MAADPLDPPRKMYGLKPRAFEHLNAPKTAPEKSVEQRHGHDEIEIRPKRSRRKRDYWLLLVGGNLLILGLVALARFNPISVIYGFSGVVILTLSLTWVMWFVMNDY